MIRDVEAVINAICADIKRRCDVAVVGLSGGADSTLVATLCRKALGKDQVYGVHMPAHDSDTNGVKFNARSSKLSFHLGIKECNAPIEPIFKAINAAVAQGLQNFGTPEVSQVNAGNARSRARMTVLYGISHHLGMLSSLRVRVVGTGNMSEDFIGYDTKGGDALCDFFPIGQLYKSEVYQLLDYFRGKREILEDHIDRIPSAGLWDGQTDEQELGYSYDLMEPAVRKISGRIETQGLENVRPEDDLEAFVLLRHLNNKHKHEAPPVTELRSIIDEVANG